MKKISTIIIFILLVGLIGCSTETAHFQQYSKYSDSFFDTFNTLTVVVAYTKSEEEFRLYFNKIHEGLLHYHKLYDIYNNYEGLNNVKTINDFAGISPVKVDQEIIDLILFSKYHSESTGGATNIALGPVLRIWHEYRTDGIDHPEVAKLPPIELLQQASQYTDLSEVVVDVENGTVFLKDRNMSLDVGAVAKGYAVEKVAQKITADGMTSGIISAGGNIRTIGLPPHSGSKKWVIGIQDPSSSIFSDHANLETLYIEEAAVVSSGDYQRYYYVGDELIHHLIDPKTLMPANHYRAITIVAADSAIADFLSTAAFLLPYPESLSLISNFPGVEAIWVLPDGEIKITTGMKFLLKSQGAVNN